MLNKCFHFLLFGSYLEINNTSTESDKETFSSFDLGKTKDE